MKNKKLILIATWLIVVLLTHLLKFNIPIGTHSASLRFMAVTLPVLAYFLPASLSLSLIGSVWFLFQLGYGTPLTLGIPTLFASLSWIASKERGAKNIAMHLVLPVVAMGSFCLSEVGSQAWPYSLFWLLPIFCTFLKVNPITRAIQSSFLAHAAGSIIWVYFMPLSSEQWISLIPVVCVERLFSVALSIALIGSISMFVNYVSKLGAEKKPQAI